MPAHRVFLHSGYDSNKASNQGGRRGQRGDFEADSVARPSKGNEIGTETGTGAGTGPGGGTRTGIAGDLGDLDGDLSGHRPAAVKATGDVGGACLTVGLLAVMLRCLCTKSGRMRETRSRNQSIRRLRPAMAV